MYITVRYGEGKSAIFNPNCRIISLLRDIKSRCGFNLNDDLELSDEAGNVKNLRELNNREKYASEFLDERESYILLQAIEVAESTVQYKPMLDDATAIDEAFMVRLSRKTEPSTKKTRGREGRRGSRVTDIGGKLLKLGVTVNTLDAARNKSGRKDSLKTGGKSDSRRGSVASVNGKQ